MPKQDTLDKTYLRLAKEWSNLSYARERRLVPQINDPMFGVNTDRNTRGTLVIPDLPLSGSKIKNRDKI